MKARSGPKAAAAFAASVLTASEVGVGARAQVPSIPLELAPNVAERFPSEVRFHGRAGGLSAWAIDGGFVVAALDGKDCGVALRFDLESTASVPPRAATAAGGVRHVLAGPDPERWAIGTQGATSIAWRGAWPGVDVVLRAEAQGFEYDLELAPGADSSAARIRCTGHRSLAVDAAGCLAIETEIGTLLQRPPIAWEVGPSGERQPIGARFRVLDPSTFGFELAQRDLALAAVIDPALVWSTYLSGEFDQAIEAVARGPLDSCVAVGWTFSIDFPTTLGAFDPAYTGGIEGFASEIAPDGMQLVWSTLIGGSGDDWARSVAVDALGRVTVGGETASTDFPATQGAHDTSLGGALDGFVARLAADGASLDFATYLGGDAIDAVAGVAVDSTGASIAVGRTRGQGFPVSGSAYDASFNGGAFAGDAFALRLSADGALVEWGTFFGGAQNELASRVALAPGGDVVVTGSAFAGGLPISSSAPDATFQGGTEAFVARFDALGTTLRYATYLGGAEDDEIRALAVRPTGEVLCAGGTTSPDFPLAQAFNPTFGGASEGFVSELSVAGDQLLRSTFVGAGHDDTVAGLALDPSGLVVIAGDTQSQDFVTTPGAFRRWYNQSPFVAPPEIFIARLFGDLSGFEYSTYFGSANEDRASALALDSQGRALFAGVTSGPNFPTTPGAIQGAYSVTAQHEGFAARLGFEIHPIPYGNAKQNSQGSFAALWWSGFPSVADQDFAVRIDYACGVVWTTVFSGAVPASQPFIGGTLHVRPPLKRYLRFKTDPFGYGERRIPLDPSLAGQTLYFQAWYEDEGDPFGASLSDALRVQIYP